MSTSMTGLVVGILLAIAAVAGGARTLAWVRPPARTR